MVTSMNVEGGSRRETDGETPDLVGTRYARDRWSMIKQRTCWPSQIWMSRAQGCGRDYGAVRRN